MEDSTKIVITLIIAFIIIVTAAIIFDKKQCNPTEMSDELRQQICIEEGLECK